MEQNEAFMTSPIGDLPINSDGLRKAVDEITRLNNEIAKLTEDRDKCIKTLEDIYTFKTTQNGLCDVFKIIRKAAIKEFAEKLRDKLSYCDEDYDLLYSFYQDDLDKLLKEYGV